LLIALGLACALGAVAAGAPLEHAQSPGNPARGQELFGA
jgi:hypothetical protein